MIAFYCKREGTCKIFDVDGLKSTTKVRTVNPIKALELRCLRKIFKIPYTAHIGENVLLEFEKIRKI